MQEIKKYHFIGIGGIGMSGLARILLANNQIVSGSDSSSSDITEALANEGAQIYKGHAAANVTSDMHIIFSSGINKENPELQQALSLNCPILHRSDLLQLLMQPKKVLAVAGTHGKTTTTSLLISALCQANLDPSYSVGGIIPHLKTNAAHGKGEYFVAEADESDGTFLKYHPYGTIITNIDNDHLDHFGTQENITQSFKQFVGQVKSSSHLFWCKDDLHLNSIHPLGVSYGFDPQSNWRIQNFQQSQWTITYDLQSPTHTYKHIEVSLTGKHNALNSAAVFALAISLDVPEQAIRHAFQSFSGIKRRCEKKGELNGSLFLDDYGHHPTEIKVTLEAVKKAIGNRKLIVAFQPHRYTRTRDCLGTFGNSFDQADELYITEIYAAGEKPIEGVSNHLIVKEVKASSNVHCQEVTRKLLAQTILQKLQPGDVVLSLGAGDITKLSDEILQKGERNS